MKQKRKWLGSLIGCEWHVSLDARQTEANKTCFFCSFFSVFRRMQSSKPTPQSKNLHWKKSEANQRSNAICSSILRFLFTSTLRRGMANDGSCSTQLIDGDGEFNVAGLDNFIKTVNLASCGLSYAVVAIMGPQSSGASRSFPLLVPNSWFTSAELVLLFFCRCWAWIDLS